jgi:hypothetical protein
VPCKTTNKPRYSVQVNGPVTGRRHEQLSCLHRGITHLRRRKAGASRLVRSDVRGDPERYNPEELLVSSLSTCHMLWYLHLCAEARLVVLEYVDEASGSWRKRQMAAAIHGGLTQASGCPRRRLRSRPGLSNSMTRTITCVFIANSVNFPVAP